MNDHDKALRDALALDEVSFLRQFEEPPLADQVIATFRGQKRGLTAFGFLFGAGFTALMVVSAVQFFQVETTRAMIAWACVFGFAALSTGLIKIWYFMELNKFVVVREVKRLELQVARLSDRLANSR